MLTVQAGPRGATVQAPLAVGAGEAGGAAAGVGAPGPRRAAAPIEAGPRRAGRGTALARAAREAGGTAAGEGALQLLGTGRGSVQPGGARTPGFAVCVHVCAPAHGPARLGSVCVCAGGRTRGAGTHLASAAVGAGTAGAGGVRGGHGGGWAGAGCPLRAPTPPWAAAGPDPAVLAPAAPPTPAGLQAGGGGLAAAGWAQRCREGAAWGPARGGGGA